MKKIILISLVALTAFAYSPFFKAPPTEHIKVSQELEPYFNEMVEIVDRNDLNVDWSKINAVILVPLSTGIQGYCPKNSGVVIVSHYFKYPPDVELTDKQKSDYIILTLAHEIGHSQGLVHIEPDKKGLMSPHSRYDLGIIKSTAGVEQYIVDCFKNKL